MTIKPYSENRWFSPRHIINALSWAGGKADTNTLKHLKEAWICAVALICRARVEPQEWWIQIPKQDPPDLLAAHFVPFEEGRSDSLSVQPVEVFEISQYDSDEDLFNSIQRKLNGQDYRGMLVVGFVMRSTGFNHIAMAARIKALGPKVGALDIILVEDSGKPTEMSCIELFPMPAKRSCDFGKVCRESKQEDYIELMRGTKPTSRNISSSDDVVTIVPR